MPLPAEFDPELAARLREPSKGLQRAIDDKQVSLSNDSKRIKITYAEQNHIEVPLA